MKYLSLFIIVIVTVGSQFSCKKCITCSNTCYACTHTTDTLCSTDFQTQQLFDTIIASIRSNGSTCTQIAPTKSVKICDKANTVQNFETYYEGVFYTCR